MNDSCRNSQKNFKLSKSYLWFFFNAVLTFKYFILQIGDIIRYAGSFCSMIYMFFLPCCIWMMHQKQTQGRIPLWSYLLHGLLMAIGLGNFIIQFTITAYWSKWGLDRKLNSEAYQLKTISLPFYVIGISYCYLKSIRSQLYLNRLVLSILLV